MTHALVTGASGFIGTHLVQRLCEKGHDVTCLVRGTSDRSRLEPFSPRFVVGDVIQYDSIRRAMDGVDVVYHLAGTTKCLRAEQFEQVNLDGARNVAHACRERNNPPVLVLVSSLAAAGPADHDRLRTESDPPLPVSNYGHSKLAGEYAAMLYADDVPLTIVRPPIVLGEADRDGFALFESIARWGLHFVPSLTDARYSVVHADDLAAAMMLAAERGRRVSSGDANQGIYFAAADETPTYGELGRMIGRSVGQDRVIIVRNPKSAVWCIASISELFARLRNQPHILNWDKAKEATAGSWACSSAALQRDTGFTPVKTLQARLDQTAQWYVAQGWLKTTRRLAPSTPEPLEEPAALAGGPTLSRSR